MALYVNFKEGHNKETTCWIIFWQLPFFQNSYKVVVFLFFKVSATDTNTKFYGKMWLLFFFSKVGAIGTHQKA